MKKEYCPFDTIPEHETKDFYIFLHPLDLQQQDFPYSIKKDLHMSNFNVDGLDPMRLFFNSTTYNNTTKVGTLNLTITNIGEYVIDSIVLIIGDSLTFDLYVKHYKRLVEHKTTIKYLELTSNI